jgi:hypothetical protein
MDRMKWTRDGFEIRSACGRFVIRRHCQNPKWWNYWSLTDTRSGTEYPCRTEVSAKTAARNLLTRGVRA